MKARGLMNVAAFAVCIGVFTAQAVINDSDLIPVTDYSWLQLRDGFRPFIGNPTTGNVFYAENDYMGHNTMWGFCSAIESWCPRWPLTERGAGDYWAGIEFTKARKVHKLGVWLRANEGVTVRRYTIEGSTDGTNFTAIGSRDFGSFRANLNPDYEMVDLTVTNRYKAVRIYFRGTNSTQDGQGGSDPDYTFGNDSRAGPGFWCIEPFGDDDILASEINVANKNLFSTAVSANVDKWDGNYNNGSMGRGATDGVGVSLAPYNNKNGDINRDDLPGWPGGWPTGRYIQMDLGEAQRIHAVKFVMARNNWPRGTDNLLFEYANDAGGPFTRIPYAKSFIDRVSNPDQQGRTPIAFQFEPVEARYWRVAGADMELKGENVAFFIKQWMFYQTSHPTPLINASDHIVTIGEFGSATITPQDIDSLAAPEDGYARSFSRDTFYWVDAGKSFSVSYLVDDGTVYATTNITVTVQLDPALEGKISVDNYNWLQLPAAQVQISGHIVNDDLTEGNPLNSGYASYPLMRWGSRAWLPGRGNGNGTDTGATNYAVAVTFDKPRYVSKVVNQWHLESGITVSRYYVDGMDANGNWAPIGTNTLSQPWTQNYPGSQTGESTLPVVAGDYKAVRVRIMAGDYEPGTNGAYGGPGFWSIQPYGGGVLEENEVNWANAIFSTTTAQVGGNFRNATLNSGSFTDWDTLSRYGNDSKKNGDDAVNAWDTYDANAQNAYAQIDLGELRWFDRAVMLWVREGYSASDIDVLASATGTAPEDFTRMDFIAYTNMVSLQSGYVALEATFAPVKARYVRLANPKAHKPNSGVFINQLLVMGCAEPPPPPPKGTLVIIR